MIDAIVNDPLAYRRVPVAYSGAEVREAMERMSFTHDTLAEKWRMSARTVRRMCDMGAKGACAAALNAELRLHFYRPQLYARVMDMAIRDSIP